MMARTGFCDSRPLLDPCKTEETRIPLRTWANVCAVKARRVYNEGEGLRSGQQHKAENKDERRWIQRLPLSAEDGIMDYAQKNGSTPSVDGYKEEAVLNHLHRVQGLPTLRQLVPGLLQREIEVAMDKLGLLFDRTYAWDVFSDMMRSQLNSALPNGELPRPFTDTTRAILVDWLIQVHEVFSFSEETLYLAVHLLNRALRQIKVSISSLQLLGVVCLFLAAKKEECLLPEVSELCYLMANTYTKKQLLRMERRVLSGLRFELSHCPPIHFLLLSAYIARCSDKVICMARYLLELSLLEGQCVLYLPTHLAGAALHLARRLLQEAPTPEGEAAWCIASNIHLGSEATLFQHNADHGNYCSEGTRSRDSGHLYQILYCGNLSCQHAPSNEECPMPSGPALTLNLRNLQWHCCYSTGNIDNWVGDEHISVIRTDFATKNLWSREGCMST